MQFQEIIAELKYLGSKKNLSGMKRFGINTSNALGISVTTLRRFAKQIGTNHSLALELWNSEIHEARILATIIDDFKKVSKSQMNSWANDFDSWDLCDQCCNNLFRKTDHAINYSFEWTKRNEEFIKRAGFVLIAVLAFHKKDLTNYDLEKYFPIIIQNSTDERNFVKKAVNWSLRQIGKRNVELNKEAIMVCKELAESNSTSAVWIANNAVKELSSKKVQNKFLINLGG